MKIKIYNNIKNIIDCLLFVCELSESKGIKPYKITYNNGYKITYLTTY